MLKRSHAILGATAGLAAAQATGEPMLAGAVVGALAGVAPDGDHPDSAVGRLLPRWFHRLTPGHRGITHSVTFCLLVSAGIAWWSPTLALFVAAGLLAHLLGDGVTEAGIPWLYPFSRQRLALPRLLAIKTGGWAEGLIVVGVLALAGWRMTGGGS